MPPCARVLCVFTLLAAPVAAQSTTEDGIRATLGGDYREALRILRPLADDTVHPDAAAQFFLAILQDTGHGGGGNTRACGLFQRAARRPNPFAGQSAALATVIREQLGEGASVFCIADESWQGGPPLSFTLGPEHRIVFADTSVRVTYYDQEQATTMVPSQDAVSLSIQYTPLTVTQPTAARRHFFQWFTWVRDPTAQPSAWKLYWALSEVVGAQWLLIKTEVFAVVSGPAPPASHDVSNLVRLQVNANGDAEFAIVGGGTPRTERIPLKGGR